MKHRIEGPEFDPGSGTGALICGGAVVLGVIVLFWWPLFAYSWHYWLG